MKDTSNAELLATAWKDALNAREAGLIVGTPDELALRAAARRAVNADLAAEAVEAVSEVAA